MTENAIEILIGVALHLYITLGSIAFLTILSLPIHKHRMSFHMWVVFLSNYLCEKYLHTYKKVKQYGKVQRKKEQTVTDLTIH